MRVQKLFGAANVERRAPISNSRASSGSCGRLNPSLSLLRGKVRKSESVLAEGDETARLGDGSFTHQLVDEISGACDAMTILFLGVLEQFICREKGRSALHKS